MLTDNMFKRKLKRLKKRGERYKKEKEIRDTYAPYVPERNKRKTSNIMLVIIVIAIIGYVIADFWLQLQTGLEISPTITTCWFTFWGTEIVALTGIKISKVFRGSSCNMYEAEGANILDEGTNE
jgi:hypothetical protein